MKIKRVTLNNRMKCFEVKTLKRVFPFPYSRLGIKPTPRNRVQEVIIDREAGCEAFTYRLKSGEEGTIHLDHVLEYHRNPEYLREMLLYKLTLKAQKLLESGGVRKREVIRRMGTKPAHFYRLLDQTFYHKTIDQMVKLLAALDCPVEIAFRKAA